MAAGCISILQYNYQRIGVKNSRASVFATQAADNPYLRLQRWITRLDPLHNVRDRSHPVTVERPTRPAQTTHPIPIIATTKPKGRSVPSANNPTSAEPRTPAPY